MEVKIFKRVSNPEKIGQTEMPRQTNDKQNVEIRNSQRTRIRVYPAIPS
jgi:hypothetical protein